MPDRILNARLAPFTSTIFTEMSALAVRTGAVNLGQGFPDTDGPTEVVEAAVAALRSGLNQYAPGPGVLELRAAVADHQRRFYGIDLDPDSQVVITFGATEGLASSILGLCEPGDEVIIIEPWYDSYGACIALAGARRRVVGFSVFPPQGTFFVVTDAAPLGAEDGLEFCLSLPERVGVVAVPVSVFYDDPAPARTLVRFAFPKRTEVLDEGLARLKGLARGAETAAG